MLLKVFLLTSLFYLCVSEESFYISNILKERKVTKIPYFVTKPIIKRSKNFSVRPVIKEVKEEEKVLVVTKPIIKRFKFFSTTPTTFVTQTEQNNVTEYILSAEPVVLNNTFTTTKENHTNDKLNVLDLDLLKKTLTDCKYRYYSNETEQNINDALSFLNDETDYSNYHFSIKLLEKYLPLFKIHKPSIENVNKKMYNIKNNFNQITNFTKNDINIGIKTSRENFGTYLCSKIFKTLKGYENVLNIKIFSRNLIETPVCNIIFSSFILPNINLDDYQFVVQQQVVIPLEHLPAYQICENGKIMINC